MFAVILLRIKFLVTYNLYFRDCNMFVCWFFQCLLVLLSVAFFTLFERKVIGLFHNRLGPNKVSFIGLVQPLLDAFKLLTKQKLVPLRSNKVTYHFSPHLALCISLFIWITLPIVYSLLNLNYSVILFYCVGSSIVFSVLLSGWSSNSKYSLIGALRSIAQSISYESVLSTLIIILIFCSYSYSIRNFHFSSSLFFVFLFPLWFICTLAETHRAPFDFREAESELVSGFNTEYSGAYFAFLFLSEYSVLLFSCFVMTYIFLRWALFLRVFLVVFISLSFSFLFIWVRVTFCRFRYDLLMIASWKIFLPFVLFYFLFILIIFILF